MQANLLKQASDSLSLCCPGNLEEWEEWASIGAGVGFLTFGLMRRRGGWGMMALGAALVARGVTGYCPMYAMTQPQSMPRRSKGVAARHGIKIESSITIHRPVAEVYAMWSDLSQLPQRMSHLVSVTKTGDRTSHWVARGPMETELPWDAEIIQQKENALIAWQSLPGSVVDTAGSVRFREVSPQSTEIRVSLKYDPPGGAATAYLAEFFGMGVEETMADDLHRFKESCESSGVARSMATASE